MPKHITLLVSRAAAPHVASALIAQSRWFDVVPMPDGQYEFEMKDEPGASKLIGNIVKAEALEHAVSPVPEKGAWVLVIDNDAGVFPSLHRTRDSAVAALHTYVKDCWKDEMGDLLMPDDPEAAIDQYYKQAEGDLAHMKFHTFED